MNRVPILAARSMGRRRVTLNATSFHILQTLIVLTHHDGQHDFAGRASLTQRAGTLGCGPRHWWDNEPDLLSQRLAAGAVRRQGSECGNGQIKPREPCRPQRDATTLREAGSPDGASRSLGPGVLVGEALSGGSGADRPQEPWRPTKSFNALAMTATERSNNPRDRRRYAETEAARAIAAVFAVAAVVTLAGLAWLWVFRR